MGEGPPRLPALVLRSVLEPIEAAGYQRQRELRRVGVEPSVLDDPEGRVDVVAVLGLWERAIEVTGDPDVGLLVAETHSEGLGLFEYVLRAAETVGEAWRRACVYYKLVHEGVEPSLKPGPDGAVALTFEMPPAVPRAIPEFILATFVVKGRAATRTDWAPRRVCFAHPRPAEVSRHRRLFRAPLAFDQPCHAVVVDEALLELPQITADSGLSEVLEGYARGLLARLPREHDLVFRVREAVAFELCGGDPGVESIAAKLGMSPRTLHRRLSEQGTNHRSVVDELRQELSVKYVSDGGYTAGEIAFLLGYSETSAFLRAFKRWMGCSPREYRAEHAP